MEKKRDGNWIDQVGALPGQTASPSAVSGSGSKNGYELETNENGEQGYWQKGKWVCTGWYDEDGYWFEEAGEHDDDGAFIANGYHDCYDPEGEWAETGFWDEEDEWETVPGYYDDEGAWVDEEPEAEKPKKKSGKGGKPGGKSGGKGGGGGGKAGGQAGGGNSDDAVYQGEFSNSGKKGKGGKPGGKKAVSDEKKKPVPMKSTEAITGEAIKLEDLSGAQWNDVPWAIGFMVFVVGTAGIGVWKNVTGAGNPCSPSPCENEGKCEVTDEGAGLYACECLQGWSGHLCQIESWKNSTDAADSVEDSTELLELNSDQVHSLIAMMMAAVMAGLAFAVVWFKVVRRYTKGIIYTTALSVVVAQVSVGIACLILGNGVGIFFIVGAAMTCVAYVIMRSYIPFATVMVRTACEVVAAHPAVLKVALYASLAQVFWFTIWVFACSGSLQSNDLPSTLFCLVSLFWVVQVIKNVVHVTAAGTAASWYFVTNEKNPTMGALRRSCTFSFGSVCFGSLVIAVLRAVRLMMPRRQGANSVSFGGMYAMCLVNCVERMMEYLNHYAFTFIAIYGYNFKSASKEVWQLLQEVGVMPMLNNHLVQAICFFGCLIGGAIGAMIGVLMTQSTNLLGTFPLWLSATICFFIGFAMTMPSMEVVESVVTAVFVCYAKNQDVLMLSNPELYEEISEAYAIMTGERLGEGAEEYDDDEDYDDYDDQGEDGEGDWEEEAAGGEEDEDTDSEYDSDGGPRKGQP